LIPIFLIFIFESNIDIDFKQTLEEYVNRKILLKEKSESIRKAQKQAY
jgi:hypothetical protein